MYRRPFKIKEEQKVAQNRSSDVSIPVNDCQFEVLWRRKSTKKHKTWEGDGVGTFVNGQFDISSDGRRITSARVASVSTGELIMAGQYEVEVAAPLRTPIAKPGADSRKHPRDLEDFLEAKAITPKMTKLDVRKEKSPAFSDVPDRTHKTLGWSPFKNPRRSHEKSRSVVNQDRADSEKIDNSLLPLLHRHQTEAACFLYDSVMGKRHLYGSGAILADEMGLGKTLVAITLIYTLLKQGQIRNALVVCPVTLLSNWKHEFRKWIGDINVGILVCSNDTDCTTFFKTNFKTYQVLIVGYERMRQVCNRLEPTPFRFDMVVCDEGHKMKSQNSKAAAAISEVVGDRRVILTGTPVQNNLGEFWSLAEFVNPGCLGSYPAFCRTFADPINASKIKDCSESARQLGKERMKDLLEVTNEFMLRRDSSTLQQYLVGNNKEYVVFCRPTERQIQMYKKVLETANIALARNQQAQALGTITDLKKVSNSCGLMIQDTPSSSKLDVLELLMRSIHTSTDEKVVVASGSTKMLDLCQQAIAKMKMPWVRLDGETPQEKRQDIVSLFNRSDSRRIFAFLLSVRSGGVGLNLIGASRLIMMDCDWNPSVDSQVFARIRRQGQTRSTFIYRLMSTGLIDEKIWQRQLTKSTLSGAVFEGVAQQDEFTYQQLRDLFSVEPTSKCNTLDLGKAVGYAESSNPDPVLQNSLAKHTELVSCVLERCTQ